MYYKKTPTKIQIIAFDLIAVKSSKTLHSVHTYKYILLKYYFHYKYSFFKGM